MPKPRAEARRATQSEAKPIVATPGVAVNRLGHRIIRLERRSVCTYARPETNADWLWWIAVDTTHNASLAASELCGQLLFKYKWDLFHTERKRKSVQNIRQIGNGDYRAFTLSPL